MAQWITGLGDVAVTAALAGLVFAWLWGSGARRAAAVWAIAFAAVGAVVAGQKLAQYACGLAAPEFGLRSISGHAALSTFVYGSVAVLVGAGPSRRTRLLVLAAAALVVGAIAWSRVALGAHSVGEVVGGAAVGAAAVAGVAWIRRRAPREPRRRAGLAALAGVLVLLLYGSSVNAEAAVRRLADGLRSNFGVCEIAPRQR
jgi:membrane-associated phospholipid phosphatase